MSARSVLAVYLGLWLATIAGAALTAIGMTVVAARAPRDALPENTASIVELLGHNAAVALWPLGLLVAGWTALPGARSVADALIAAYLLANGVVVGGQLAEFPGTWRFLPHLPLEWFALALPAAAWLHARTAELPVLGAGARARAVLPVAGGCLAALAGAAVVETYLVPIT